MRTIRQKIGDASEVRVLLDPDYAPDTPHAWTVRISRKQALELVGRAGKGTEPKGVVDSNGILLLYPHNS